jgi:uncharacterized iron-regulated membrane protein
MRRGLVFMGGGGAAVMNQELIDAFGREQWRRGEDGRKPQSFETWFQEMSAQPPRRFVTVLVTAEQARQITTTVQP